MPPPIFLRCACVRRNLGHLGKKAYSPKAKSQHIFSPVRTATIYDLTASLLQEKINYIVGVPRKERPQPRPDQQKRGTGVEFSLKAKTGAVKPISSCRFAAVPMNGRRKKVRDCRHQESGVSVSTSR